MEGSVGGETIVEEAMSRRMLERPTMAAGWSGKCVTADSKWTRAIKGSDSARETCPRWGWLVL
jgi:hypothetical protein